MPGGRCPPLAPRCARRMLLPSDGGQERKDEARDAAGGKMQVPGTCSQPSQLPGGTEPPVRVPILGPGGRLKGPARAGAGSTGDQKKKGGGFFFQDPLARE